MNILEFSLLVGLGSFAAGFLGSLTGLGGGVVIVPLLTIMFGVDIRYAIGASLVSVIATSSGAASAYVKEGYTNMRIGMFLEVATAALAGRRRGIIQLGLLLLIATPVVRVAFSLLAFVRQRDWTYIIVTAIVLAGLLYSLIPAHS